MSHLIIHIAGARPNFPKVAPVMAALSNESVDQLLVHTGQHYDDRMSDIFFRQLNIPLPDINLGVGSGSHAAQTAAIMVGLEELFLEKQPDLVVVYGDVNSTVAAALVATKLHIKIAHVEAGLRSFDRAMPEEINRIITDQLADLLLTTSADAQVHLGREGVAAEKIRFVGNPMIDTLLNNKDRFDASEVMKNNDISGPYVLSTVHRPSNVDSEADAQELVRTMHQIADQCQLVLPLHPRGRPRLEKHGLSDHPNMRILDPLGYLEFLGLQQNAAVVVTDSGGVQEETTILGIPCLTLRPNTERPVTITHGTNKLTTRDQVPGQVKEILSAGPLTEWDTPPLWDGKAGVRIAREIMKDLG